MNTTVKYNSKLAAWSEWSLWRFLVALVELILIPDEVGLCRGSVKCRSRAWCESVRLQLASISQIKGTDRHADPWPDNLWLPLSRPIENREEKFRKSGFWLEPEEECENPEERETGRDGSATAGLNSSRNPVVLFYFSFIFLKKKKETKAGRGKKILAFSYVRHKYLNVNYKKKFSVVKMEAFHFLLHFLKENMTRYCVVFCFPHYKICSYCFIAKIRKNILKKYINKLNYCM